MRRFTVAAAALPLLLVGCGTLLAPPEPPLVIAADLNLTGDHPDTVARQALELRISQITERGLVTRPIELRVSDNRGDPAVARDNLASAAADPQVVAVIIGGCRPCLLDNLQQVTDLPVVSLALGEDIAAPANERRTVFQLAPQPLDTAVLLAEQMAQDDVATAVVVATDSPHGTAGVQATISAAAFEGIEIVDRHELPTDPSGRQLERVAATVATWQPAPADPFAPPPPAESPDAVVLWTHPGHTAALAQALREHGWQGLLYLDMAAVDDLFLPGDGLTGARLAHTRTAVADQVIAGTPAAIAQQQWLASYVAAYGTYHLGSAVAADAADVIVAALDVGQPDRAAVRDSLEALRSHPGLAGPIAFRPDQHSGLSSQALVILAGGPGRWAATVTN